jgi:hypothetical protein
VAAALVDHLDPDHDDRTVSVRRAWTALAGLTDLTP